MTKREARLLKGMTTRIKPMCDVQRQTDQTHESLRRVGEDRQQATAGGPKETKRNGGKCLALRLPSSKGLEYRLKWEVAVLSASYCTLGMFSC